MSTEGALPEPADSGRRSPGRVLAAVWLGVSQALFIGAVALVLWVLSVGIFPFASLANDPGLGFLSGIGLRGRLYFPALVVVGSVVLGIVVGSWTLWVRRQHGLAVLVSSLPLLVALLLVIWTS